MTLHLPQEPIAIALIFGVPLVCFAAAVTVYMVWG